MNMTRMVMMTILSILMVLVFKFSFLLGTFCPIMYTKWWLFSSFSILMSLSALMMVLVLMLLASPSGSYYLLLLSSGLIPVMFFNSGHWATMLIFYELSLVPISWMILILGKQPERLRASRFILLYTVLFSVPFILSLQTLMEKFNVLWVWELTMLVYFFDLPSFCGWGMGLGFLVKVPMIFLHYWLPKAHVEASTSGSVLLAGVLLKMGALGLYQLSFLFSSLYGAMLWWILLGLSAVGGGLAALQALLATDMKIIVALASVSHMNFSLTVYTVLTILSTKSFIMYNFAHSVVSSSLFFLVSEMYAQSNSRSILMNKGKASSTPIKWVAYLLWAANMSLPPFMSFIAEILGLMSVSTMSIFVVAPVLTYIILSSLYSVMNMVVLTGSKPSGIGTKMSIKSGLTFFVLIMIPFVSTWSTMSFS
uniref:NADH-ubiquinone oxidoreductase chain 4 n=1 Tax=Polyplax spinulosa TaxID=468197 RepID=V9PXG4_9NEOP|nr:NADH dehydrogenase subunit 4 [Polyplax spinulosa]